MTIATPHRHKYSLLLGKVCSTWSVCISSSMYYQLHVCYLLFVLFCSVCVCIKFFEFKAFLVVLYYSLACTCSMGDSNLLVSC